jgi:phosphohistidine phosphatase SixA
VSLSNEEFQGAIGHGQEMLATRQALLTCTRAPRDNRARATRIAGRNVGAALRRATLIAVIVLMPAAVSNVSAQEADNVEEAWNALSGDGVVLILRHAIAPGAGDPPGFRLDDCSTQRNLSAEGRAQAERLGALLRSRGVRITRVMSSPWCRAMDTARLMGFTGIEVNDALWNLVHNPPDREAKVAEARSLIRNWRGPGVLLLSTHGSTIRAVIGASFYPPSGGSVVVQPDPKSPLGLRTVSRLPPP